MAVKKISIVIPVWNEEENVKKLVESLDNALRVKGIIYELIFIDDHSTDKTCEIIENLSENYPISLHLKKSKKGKAYSLLEGFTHAQYDLIGIIDADLQYPPEAIPEMIKKIAGGADIVVVNRKRYHDSKFRKILSRTFRIGFGGFLFGLNHDVQAGLKVFKKEVVNVVNFQPASGWTFDLEFLHRAREAGFKIENHDITFHPRNHGGSKVRFLRTGWELATSAIRLKIKPLHPRRIPPLNSSTMIGAGVGFKQQKYITHTTLPHHKSAIQTVVRKQKLFLVLILLALLAGFTLAPWTTARAIIAVLSFIYFIDVVFNLFLILKSLHFPQEITFTDEELKNLDESLPVYSILCPLYREADILPQFLQAIDKLDWPKDKLDLILLLEEDDRETIGALGKIDLPPYARRVIVPHSLPKTKPKACNYGLAKAKGEYLVIYDAEDLPDPLQLKKAYLGFKKAPSDVVCLQAKLNYYNPHQNLLTRLFTAEYSLWFDVVLTGLQSVETSIPLGGTSNHFKRRKLLELEGWDPFNVTEDADLGVRLFRQGYKTAMIDSTTLEEANSKLGNWLRQRSRWIKGYMQTYLVHTREAFTFTKEQGFHALIFQLTIGGKIAFILINPLLWIATIAYFTLYRYVGPTIEFLYPSLVFYMAAISLVLGNFMFIYYYMIGAVKRGQWSLVKYVYLVPFYWLITSFAGAIAFYQLIFRPHYWEKTVHGFHLRKPLEKVIPEVAIRVGSGTGFWLPFPSPRKLLNLAKSKKGYLSGSSLIISLVIGNFLNFLFNAYLGREIDLSNFALVNLAGAFLSLSSIPFSAFGITINYRSGFLIGRFDVDDYAYNFWRYMRKNSFFFAAILTVIWILLLPFLTSFFKTDEIFLFLLFGAVIFIRFAASADWGFLSARLMFTYMALLTISEPILKLIIAFVLVQLSLPSLTYTAIPLSVLGAFFFGWFLVTRGQRPKSELPHQAESKYFPKKFFFASLLSGLSTMTFLSLDILLAKHFLPPEEAGQYALVSLAGKMIYFLGSLSSPFLMPLVSRNEGANQSSQKTFSLILLSATVLSVLGFVVFGLLGEFTVPILFGPKASGITSYLIVFSFAMVCFAVSKVFTAYYLAKKVYTFPIAALFSAIVQIVLISLYHFSIGSIVFAMALTGILNLTLMIALHLGLGWVKIFESNFIDFLGLFAKEAEVRQSKEKQLKILIFNWRDIKHKFAGGAEVYVQEFAKRWAKEGHQVTLFCGNDGKHVRQENIDGVEIIRYGGFYFVYIWAFLYYIFRFKGKYDVIIDCENGIPFFTPLFARREKKFLLIHHIHQEVFRKSLFKPLAWFASFLELKLMPLVYRNIQFITISPSSKQAILENNLTRLDPIVIYSGVDLRLYKPAEKSKIPLVLYLGRLKYYKSINVFIKAAKEVLKIIPDVQFVIAGDGEKRKGLMEFAQKLGLGEKIRFLGKVSEEDKIQLYQQTWVFVNPSLIEGWGITTIEANACGTPVVASDVPGLRDSVENPHSGILVPWGDVEQFAYSIEKIIVDGELRADMEKASLAWAQNFSWEKSAKAFLDVLTVK